MRVLGFRLPGMSSLILWGLVWEAVGRSGLTFFLPPLSEVFTTFLAIVGFGALFELYSANFLMSHFWAVLVVLFALAFAVSEVLAALERRVSYYAAKR